MTQQSQPPHPLAHRARSRRGLLTVLAAAILPLVAWIVTGPLSLAGADEAPVSQGRPATASSVEGAHWPASAAVDGDITSRWSSAFRDPQWLEVDLGAATSVDRVVLRWENAYATAFQIQLSPDGASWTTVYSTAGGAGGTQTITVAGQGRYVRMYGTARATQYGYSLWEFQVYGTPGGDTASSGASATGSPATAMPSMPDMPSSGATSGSGDGYVMADPPVTGVVPSTANPPHRYFHEFQANCAVSHHQPDDPIVFFNKPGASHDHTFMGNITTNAATTLASLHAGGTLCKAPGDRSGYWMPTMYNGDQVVLPVGPQVIYYKTGVNDYTSVRPFPPGLRFVVGSPMATAAQFSASPAYQKGWECGNSYENVDFPATCPATGDVQLNIRMQAPSCWDGLHLDTPDHKSHMAYPVNGVCPVDHPVAVPMIEFKMAFPVNGDMSKVRLSSGRGYSFHYDFYNAWDPATLAALVVHCVNGGLQCNAQGYDETHPEAGAALDPLYQVPGSQTALDRTGWSATASAADGDAAKMLDGDLNTRWTTGTPMSAGQSVTVDMRAAHTIDQVSFIATGTDYARGYAVYLSTDGVNWAGPVATGAGFMPLVTATFGPQAARYVKLVQTASASNWWSIAEFNAFIGK